MTEFRRRRKPSVRIAKYLSASADRENQLRSTLAHEYAYVVFHGFLWTLEGGGRKPGQIRPHYRRCQRSRVVAAPQTDWMEWQAGYAGGALLMPITPLRAIVEAALAESGTDRHAALVRRVAEGFAVSRDAAAFRLAKLGYVAPEAAA